MELSNFPNGITIGGYPVYGSIIPPITGDYFHVCPGSSTIVQYKGRQVVGSSSNSGENIAAPLDSIATAYTKCTSGAGDGIILWSYGTTTAMCSSYLSSAMTWSKHGITTVGIGSPTTSGQRARVANASTATGLANLITVTGNNNQFINTQFLQAGSAAGALGCVDVTGLRNTFVNCDMQNVGAASVLLTGHYTLQMNGPAEDNAFYHCTIGQTSTDEDGSYVVTGTIKLTGISGGASGNVQSNVFERCRIKSYYSYAASTSGLIHMVGSGDSIDRDQFFRDCSFVNFKLSAPMTTPPAAMVVGTAPNNGVICLEGQTFMKGYTAYAAASYGRVFIASGPTAGTAGGLSVVTPS